MTHNPEDRISPTDWRAEFRKEFESNGMLGTGITPIQHVEDFIENLLTTQAATYAAREKEVVEKVEKLESWVTQVSEFDQEIVVSRSEVLALLQSNPQ